MQSFNESQCLEITDHPQRNLHPPIACMVCCSVVVIRLARKLRGEVVPHGAPRLEGRGVDRQENKRNENEIKKPALPTIVCVVCCSVVVIRLACEL